MKQFISTLALTAALLASGAAFAQAPANPAKGNAPLKPTHTINDGGARRGANSFTERQARTHIEKAGFTAVTGLAKGRDGVWRGTAMRNGQSTAVAMDFKGNVTTPLTAANAAPPAMPMTAQRSTATQPAAAAAATGAASSTMASHHPMAARHHMARHHRRHWRRHHGRSMSHTGSCANPGVNGAACSGVDRNHNGISDKEDRAIKAGAKP